MMMMMMRIIIIIIIIIIIGITQSQDFKHEATYFASVRIDLL